MGTKPHYRLHWLQTGDEIKTGDYCWDQRVNPIEHTAIHYWKGQQSKRNPPIFMTSSTHPHFRLIKS